MGWIRVFTLSVTVAAATPYVGGARCMPSGSSPPVTSMPRGAPGSVFLPRSALYQETDFSGYWARDPAASRVETSETLAGLAGGGAPDNLFVSQARNGTLVVSSRHNPSLARVYRIGGESLVAAPGEQGGMMRLTTRWQERALVSEGSVASGAETLQVREVLSLSDDGSTLVLEVSLTGPGGEASNRLVYRRWPGR